MAQDVERKPITKPESDHPDDQVRVVAEAGLTVIPFMSSLFKLFNAWFPTQAQKSRSRWEGAVTEQTNQHAERLDRHDQALNPQTSLSGPAVQLAVALARTPGDGMAGQGRRLEDLCALLPDVDRETVQAAAFELNAYGLVRIDRAIGRDNWWLRLNQRFYEQIDHQVMGWQSTTANDARTLANLLLEDEGRERTSVLHAASGWDKRRFNPAFQFLLGLIPDERASGEIQPNYPSSSVFLLEEDRAKLRKFIASGP